MTLKQKKLAQAYLKTGNKTQAAILAGYSPRSAHVTGFRVLEKVKPELNRLMDRAGLSEHRLLDPIREGLKANAIYQGIETVAPDHANRLKSSELAWKLRGHLRPTPDEDADRVSPILILSAGTTVILQEPALTLTHAENGSPAHA